MSGIGNIFVKLYQVTLCIIENIEVQLFGGNRNVGKGFL